MRDLYSNEAIQVKGGFGPAGAILGGIGGGLSAAIDGGDSRAIAKGVVFGALSGITGGLAAITSGFTRIAWSIRSVSSGVIAGLDPNTSTK